MIDLANSIKRISFHIDGSISVYDICKNSHDSQMVYKPTGSSILNESSQLCLLKYRRYGLTNQVMGNGWFYTLSKLRRVNGVLSYVSLKFKLCFICFSKNDIQYNGKNRQARMLFYEYRFIIEVDRIVVRQFGLLDHFYENCLTFNFEVWLFAHFCKSAEIKRLKILILNKM